MKTTIKTALLLAAVFGLGVTLSKAADAKENFETTCAKCHGKDGQGKTKMGQKLDIKDLTDAKVQAGLTDDQAFKTIKEGITENGSLKMKAYADKFSDDEIKALVAYVRTFKK